MGTILKTNNLTKIYKGVTVVDKLNITLNKGEIYGFIGKNGAGKTTTIKMIMGLIKANRGEIELFGSNKNNERIYGKIGSIIEYPGFYPNLTAKENLEIHSHSELLSLAYINPSGTRVPSLIRAGSVAHLLIVGRILKCSGYS